MAKIRSEIIRTFQKDIIKDFNVNLMYSSDWLKFHIEIPLELYDIVIHIPYELQTELSIVSKKAKGSDSRKYYINGETEKICLENTKKGFEYLVDKAVVQRNVIIVFYNPKDLCNYNDHVYNGEHPQIGMQFGLTYAVESTVGEKKVYSIYPEGGYRNGATVTNRKEINIWNKSCTIIPDTPENRNTLENLYNAFTQLNEKLKLFMSSPEKLLEFIQTNVKLLN